MGDDISSGAKIGITLVILVALVGIVFSLLTMMKNITNSGSNQLQNGLNQLLSTQAQDYDQKIVTGTTVNTAMSIFSDQTLAFVVKTAACQKSGSSYANGFVYGALLTGFNATTTEQASDGAAYTLTTALHRNTGEGHYTTNLYTTGGYKYNLNFKPTGTSGTSSYVRDSAKFLAELIYDDTGTWVGICFTQQ
jgi:hypothetical protein